MIAIPMDQLFRISVDKYRRMADAGVFDDGPRVELVEGAILEMAPQKTPHASIVTSLNMQFARSVPRGFMVRPQLPLTLSGYSEPEPDLAIVTTASQGIDKEDHPATAHLVVEVTDSTLTRDRRKAAIYARAGIPEYWIVDIKKRAVEVLQEPVDGAYTKVRRVTRGKLTCSTLRSVAVDVPALFRP